MNVIILLLSKCSQTAAAEARNTQRTMPGSYASALDTSPPSAEKLNYVLWAHYVRWVHYAIDLKTMELYTSPKHPNAFTPLLILSA